MFNIGFFSIDTLAENFRKQEGLFQYLDQSSSMEIEKFSDPLIPNVHCYLGVARSPSVPGMKIGSGVYSMSLDCAVSGLIKLSDDIENGKREGEEVYMLETRSPRHAVRVNRYYDREKNTLVYIASNHKLTGETPLMALSAVQLGTVTYQFFVND